MNHIEGVENPALFRAIDEEHGTDEHFVFFGAEVLTDADPESFVPLGGCFAKDRDRVWAYGEAVDGAEAESFQALTEEVGRDRHRAYVVAVAYPADGAQPPSCWWLLLRGSWPNLLSFLR